jgi:hypothetical protein
MEEKARRYSRQQQMEKRSVHQFSDHLSEFGWLVDPIPTDLGEDVRVRIYDEGNFSGISFDVQIKSTEDLHALIVKGDDISYRKVKVGNLLDWEQSATPVVFVVWDIESKTGVWVNVTDVISELDLNNANWRYQKTTRVRIPSSNMLDAEGLKRLRRELARYYYLTIYRDRPLETKVRGRVPNTPEGLAVLDAFERSWTKGDPVDVSGRFLEIEFSEWYTRLRGGGLTLTNESRLKLGTVASGHIIPTRFDLIAEGDTASLPYVEMKNVKQGFDESTATNEHQPISVHITMIVNSAKRNMTINFRSGTPGADVRDARDALLFLTAASKDGILRITNLDTNQSVDLKALEVQASAPDPEFMNLVEKLCLIQGNFGCRLTLKDWSISNSDEKVINDLVTIFETGQLALQNTNIAPTLEKDALELSLETLLTGKAITWFIQDVETTVTLLETDIPLGPAKWKITGIPNIPIEELEATLADMEPGDKTQINFVVYEGVVEFLKWSS